MKQIFKVLSMDDNLKSFERLVNDHLLDGWQLHGDTQIVVFHEKHFVYREFYQAVVKIEPETGLDAV